MNQPINRFAVPPWLALAGLVLALGTVHPQAQDTNAPLQTNEVGQGEPSPSDEEAVRELGPANQTAHGTNEFQAGPTKTAPGESPRAHWLEQHRQNNDRSSNASLVAESSSVATVPSPLDFSAFNLITERNIFDPNRMPHSGPVVQAKTVDAFSLVGTMSYSKGDFAFFDGTSADYKKVLKPAESIAGYTVLAIASDSVKLGRDNKQIELPIGTQMRRQEDGTWSEVAGAGSYTSSSTASSSNSQSGPGSSGAESDILKRLMERREKE